MNLTNSSFIERLSQTLNSGPASRVKHASKNISLSIYKQKYFGKKKCFAIGKIPTFRTMCFHLELCVFI